MFNLRWQDIELIQPCANPKHRLPPGTGALLLRLLEAAKGNQTRTAHHIIACHTSSGLKPGFCFETLSRMRAPDTPPLAHIFVADKGRVWNSCHFRELCLCLGLSCQWLDGDPLLQTHVPHSAEDIPEKLCSLHSYRRGARTHVSKK